MRILDCTLRDGGYCNDWEWAPGFAQTIVSALYPHVDIIEIGYRKPYEAGFLRCSDGMVDEYFQEYSDKIAVMIDLKDYIKDNMLVRYLFGNHFCKKNSQPITYIRVACTIETLDCAIEATKILHEYGYKTTINIMKASLLKGWELSKINKMKDGLKHIEYLYFADSFGTMNYGILQEIYRDQYESHENLGLHPHNNKSLAFSLYKNTSFDIIDSSIGGLGRGAGNLDTIQVLMDRDGKLDEKLYKCLKVIERIKAKAQCGYCYEYHYCAKNDIHPNYAVHLKGLHRYGRYEIIRILGNIDNNKRNSFDKVWFEELIYKWDNISYE